MDGLLWLIVFGVLFFVMVRYGCGTHIARGGHGDGGHGGTGSAQGGGKDQECGMNVLADKGYSMAWSGATYRFCSRSCLEKFEADPKAFAEVGVGSEQVS